MKNDVEKLLQKQMDRKDFIKHVGIGFAAIMGVTAIAKTLSAMTNGGKSQSSGYGSSAYGGSTSSSKTVRKQS